MIRYGLFWDQRSYETRWIPQKNGGPIDDSSAKGLHRHAPRKRALAPLAGLGPAARPMAGACRGMPGHCKKAIL